MITRTQAFKITRLFLGLCVSAALIYFLYSKNSAPGVRTLIVVTVVLFLILRRRSGAFDKDPYFRRLALVGSRKPIRDIAMALFCVIAMLAVTVAMGTAIKHHVLPDNYVTAGVLIAVIISGVLGTMFFISGVIGRIFFGPPPP
jgi:hypothetical protein